MSHGWRQTQTSLVGAGFGQSSRPCFAIVTHTLHYAVTWFHHTRVVLRVLLVKHSVALSTCAVTCVTVLANHVDCSSAHCIQQDVPHPRHRWQQAASQKHDNKLRNMLVTHTHTCRCLCRGHCVIAESKNTQHMCKCAKGLCINLGICQDGPSSIQVSLQVRAVAITHYMAVTQRTPPVDQAAGIYASRGHHTTHHSTAHPEALRDKHLTRQKQTGMRVCRCTAHVGRLHQGSILAYPTVTRRRATFLSQDCTQTLQLTHVSKQHNTVACRRSR